MGLIGAWLSQQANERVAQVNRELAERAYRLQLEEQAFRVQLSHKGPRAYKCGLWRWTVHPIEGTSIRKVLFD